MVDHRSFSGWRRKVNHCFSFVAQRLFFPFMMIVIHFDAVFIGLEYSVFAPKLRGLQVVDKFIVAIYLLEFAVNTYKQRGRFWRFKKEIFDAGMLLVSLMAMLPKHFGLYRHIRPLCSVRVLKAVFSMSVPKVLFLVLLKTSWRMRSVVILGLFCILTLAGTGVSTFGDRTTSDNWTHIGVAIVSVLRTFTRDGWQNLLDPSEMLDWSNRSILIAMVVFGSCLYLQLYLAAFVYYWQDEMTKFRGKQVAEQKAKEKADTKQQRKIPKSKRHENVRNFLSKKEFITTNSKCINISCICLLLALLERRNASMQQSNARCTEVLKILKQLQELEEN